MNVNDGMNVISYIINALVARDRYSADGGINGSVAICPVLHEQMDTWD